MSGLYYFLILFLVVYAVGDIVELAYKRWFKRESHVSYRVVFSEKKNRYALHECTVIRGKIHNVDKYPVIMSDYKSKDDAEWVIDTMHIALSKPVLVYEDLFPDSI